VEFQVGTLFVEMVDPDDADPASELTPMRWWGAVNGVFGSQTPPGERLVTRLDQMFAQSQYLEVSR
jgi:hypothetical protein